MKAGIQKWIQKPCHIILFIKTLDKVLIITRQYGRLLGSTSGCFLKVNNKDSLARCYICSKIARSLCLFLILNKFCICVVQNWLCWLWCFLVPPCFQEMYRQPSQGFFERSLLEAYVGPLPISKMEPLAKIASITKSSI